MLICVVEYYLYAKEVAIIAMVDVFIFTLWVVCGLWGINNLLQLIF